VNPKDIVGAKLSLIRMPLKSEVREDLKDFAFNTPSFNEFIPGIEGFISRSSRDPLLQHNAFNQIQSFQKDLESTKDLELIRAFSNLKESVTNFIKDARIEENKITETIIPEFILGLSMAIQQADLRNNKSLLDKTYKDYYNQESILEHFMRIRQIDTVFDPLYNFVSLFSKIEESKRNLDLIFHLPMTNIISYVNYYSLGPIESGDEGFSGILMGIVREKSRSSDKDDYKREYRKTKSIPQNPMNALIETLIKEVKTNVEINEGVFNGDEKKIKEFHNLVFGGFFNWNSIIKHNILFIVNRDDFIEYRKRTNPLRVLITLYALSYTQLKLFFGVYGRMEVLDYLLKEKKINFDVIEAIAARGFSRNFARPIDLANNTETNFIEAFETFNTLEWFETVYCIDSEYTLGLKHVQERLDKKLVSKILLKRQ